MILVTVTHIREYSTPGSAFTYSRKGRDEKSGTTGFLLASRLENRDLK